MLSVTGGYGGFSVNDLDKSKDFYSDVLGLEVSKDEMGLNISLPGGGKMFVYPKENHEPATYTVLNLLVENITQAVAALNEKGVEFEQYDFPGFKTDEKGIVWGMKEGGGPNIAWFQDPSGNIFSLIENK